MPFIVFNDYFANGEFTTAVIIDLGEGNSVNTDGLSADMFTVSARNTNLDGTTVAFEGPRKVTRVYANEEPVTLGYITPGEGFPNPLPEVPEIGRYIVVEMEFFSLAGGLAHGGLTRNGQDSTIQNYSIIANAPITLSDESALDSLSFTQQDVVNPILGLFEVGSQDVRRRTEPYNLP